MINHQSSRTKKKKKNTISSIDLFTKIIYGNRIIFKYPTLNNFDHNNIILIKLHIIN